MSRSPSSTARPHADNPNNALVVVADNEIITEKAVEFMAQRAMRQVELTGDKMNPLILVGDLGDPERRWPP